MSEPHFEFRADERGGVTVLRDGHPQSHVDPHDPQLLVFEYVAQLALGLDLPPDGPLAVTHIGGAGLTLARYVQHARPGSPQIVLEPDAALTDAVRRELPLPRGHRIRVRPQEGADGLTALRDGSADAVVLDAYADGRVPGSLVAPSAITEYARVLRPRGLLLLNLADEPGRRYLSGAIATVLGHLPHAVVLATADVMKRRRFGNYVVLAGTTPFDLDDLRRRAARLAAPTTVRAARGLAADARPFTEDTAVDSPAPPELGAWRAR